MLASAGAAQTLGPIQSNTRSAGGLHTVRDTRRQSQVRCRLRQLDPLVVRRAVHGQPRVEGAGQ